MAVFEIHMLNYTCDSRNVSSPYSCGGRSKMIEWLNRETGRCIHMVWFIHVPTLLLICYSSLLIMTHRNRLKYYEIV